MNSSRRVRHAVAAVVLLAACRAPAPSPAGGASPAEATRSTISTGACDARQVAISEQADARAHPYGIAPHLEKNFPDGRVSWLMREGPYQEYVVATGADRWGRCDDTGCYLFAAPTAVIAAAVERSRRGDGHDAAALGEALGLPATNFEGPLRMMTLDLTVATTACVRLPVETDPGVWKCEGDHDEDCFRFGGYTSGGVPEVIVIDAPVSRTEIVVVE